jgi:aspartyl-tRNA(Asn)/glutamyl-tRNA(Gln) amidotransferase subunit C
VGVSPFAAARSVGADAGVAEGADAGVAEGGDVGVADVESLVDSLVKVGGVGAAVGVPVGGAVGSGVVVVGLAGLVIEGSPWAVRGSGVVNERPLPQDTPAPSRVRRGEHQDGWSGPRGLPHRLARMSSLSRDDVAHLAGLARIELSDAELDRMVGELGVILESVAKVQQAPTDGVAPMSHPMPLTNVTRPDVVRPSLGAEAVLAGAPEAELQRFSVPRILDED